MDPFLSPFEGNGTVPAGIDTGPAIRASRSQDRFLFAENYLSIGTSRDAEFASLAFFFMNNNSHNPSSSSILYPDGERRASSNYSERRKKVVIV
jgi:hypothetical protein